MVTHYIHLDAVRTTLQVLKTLKQCDDVDWLDWKRPAALSTAETGRNRQGTWCSQASYAAFAEIKASLGR